VGLLDSISVARKGLGAASAGIDVTSQNVANVGTVGYSRRKLLQSTADPMQRRGLWVGTGNRLDGVARASDRLLGARLVATAGDAARATELHSTLVAAEGYLDESGGTGLSDSVSALWDSLSSLTNNPSDRPSRQAVVSSARALASGVTRMAAGFESTIAGIDEGFTSRLGEANGKLAEVAALNRAIGRSSAETGPADLLDRRDQLVRELGEGIGATVDFDADGQATVFVGGHAVVSGQEARTLSVDSSSGTAEIVVSAGSGSIAVTRDVGGALGGAIAARDAVSGWLSELDDFAATLATTLNAQHALGFDQDGVAGVDIFTYDPLAASSSLEVSAALDDPRKLAVAGAATAAPGDGDNLVALLDLESSTDFSGATRTAAQAISDLSSGAGADVAAAEADAGSLDDQLADVDSLRFALASVDTDEEAIRLIEFQTAYRASARVLSVGDEMLRTLLSLGT